MKKSSLFWFFILICVKFCFINTNGIEQLRKNPTTMTQINGGVSQGLSSSHQNNFRDNSIPSNTYVQQFDEIASDKIAFNVLRFAHNVGKLLSENAYTSKSEIFSPVSMMASLAFLLLGSKDKSHYELSNLFGLNNDEVLYNNPKRFHREFGRMLEDIGKQTSEYRSNAHWRTTQRTNIRNVSKNKTPAEHIVKIANGLFVQKDYNLNLDFRQIMNLVYHSHLQLLDFQRRPRDARDTINYWVAQNTYGKIQNIANDDFHKDTNIILASTLYFKAFWENSFFESATTTDYFYPDGTDNPPINVKMMATGGVFPYYDSLEYKCRIIGLPYKGNLTTMYVIQPHYSTRANLKELQMFLDATKIEELISKMTRKTAVMAFPKMHFAHNMNMKNILNRLGIVEIFSRSLSDLSLISDDYNFLTTYPVSFPILRDRFQEKPLIFSSRFDEEDKKNSSTSNESLRKYRKKRQMSVLYDDDEESYYINRLEKERYSTMYAKKSDLFVENIVHKVDFEVNEHGTEAAAATLTYLRRTGTDVLFRAETPFLIMIRHDPTKLVLFYGIINEPVL